MSDRLQALQSAIGARYEVESEVSRGGMAAVYRARDTRHEREVAIKVLHPELATAVGAQRFLQEIRLVAGLQHPHVLPLYDSGETEDSLYYVMPFVDGESLRDRLSREKQLPIDVALRIARDVADALAFAHAHQIIHRDIKPENILLAGEHAVVADFGVARAIHSALGERMTATGLAVGSPAYMSPEQASGEHELDGRSDIYSLGCVLYEMLAGAPPFTGPTPHAVISKRFTTTPPSLRSLRPSVPEVVAELVKRALEVVPADRFATAKELGDAITRATTGETVTRSGGGRSRHRAGWRPIVATGIGITVAVSAVILGARAGLSRGARLDVSMYAIMPFAHRDGMPATGLDGENCARLLYDAFSRWRGITLVNDMRLHAEKGMNSDSKVSLDQALETARHLGAGRVIVGDVSLFGSAIRVRATLLDAARGGEKINEYTVSIIPNESDVEAKFREVADSLVAGSAGAQSLRVGSDTRDYQALQAYVKGYEALLDWDLELAESRFRSATELDEGYALAHLWLGQVRSWRYGAEPSEWSGFATRAGALRQKLGTREAALANALFALGERRYPQACQDYATLIARDSLDFIAWYGLAECHARDDRVIRDASSPSGWKYRTSYKTAIEAYRHALLIMPSFHNAFRVLGFERLQKLLFTQPTYFRGGYAESSETTPFGAFPSLENDTLAFVPWQRAQLFAGRLGTRPTSTGESVARNQEILQEITTKWIRTFPASDRAFEAHAVALEEIGALEGGDVASGALPAIGQARKLTSDPGRQLELTRAHVRILLKLERFDAARLLADSVVASWKQVTPDQAEVLAELAALTGRAHRTAALLARSAPHFVAWKQDGTPLTPAPAVPLREQTLRLYAYASFGSPADSLRKIMGRVSDLVDGSAAPQRREVVRRALLDQPARLAFPQLGTSAVHRRDAGGNYLLSMQWALARGDSARVRDLFAFVEEYRKIDRPGDLKIEYAFHEALIHLAMHDTSAAIARLDRSLNALSSLHRDMLDMATAVSLVRAMALRAELASQAGDTGTSRRWAAAVSTLWAGADSELQPIVERMRVMAAAGR